MLWLYMKIIFKLLKKQNLASFWIKINILLLGKGDKSSNSDSKEGRDGLGRFGRPTVGKIFSSRGRIQLLSQLCSGGPAIVTARMKACSGGWRSGVLCRMGGGVADTQPRMGLRCGNSSAQNCQKYNTLVPKEKIRWQPYH